LSRILDYFKALSGNLAAFNFAGERPLANLVLDGQPDCVAEKEIEIVGVDVLDAGKRGRYIALAVSERGVINAKIYYLAPGAPDIDDIAKLNAHPRRYRCRELQYLWKLFALPHPPRVEAVALHFYFDFLSRHTCRN
jgi:hypothetical protein